jgi:GTPase
MPSTSPRSTAPRLRHAVLVARPALDEAENDVHASMRELEQLLVGLGIQPIDTLIQRRSGPLPNTVLGTGKLEQLRERLASIEQEQAEPLLVFDGALTPAQQRHLERSLGVTVLDRTGVILDVFEQRAQTDIARSEVELARIGYETARVRDDASLTAREGGGGGRGERGHTNVELRKEQLRAREVRLQRELDRLRAAQARQRDRRSSMPRVALVGYTNAGKSSLMRGLTHGDVHIEDELFATLGTTVRALVPETHPRILVSDTVGFIRKLPHALLASFRSTLEEVCDADLLLHVVDVDDPEWRTHVEVTRSTLAALGASEIASLLLFNKVDRLTPEARRTLEAERPEAVLLSAHDPRDVTRLREKIVAFFETRMLEEMLLVPIAEARLLAEIQARARILEERYMPTHARLRVLASADDLADWTRTLREHARIETAHDLLKLARLHGLTLVTEHTDFDATGLDFLVVHAHDRRGRPWVVRTPRRADVSIAARTEARVLRLVAAHLPVAVPNWRIHAHDLIAYPRLAGQPVVTVGSDGEVSWHVVDPKQPGEVFLDSVAQVLAALQRIDAEDARRAGVPVVHRDQALAELARAMARTKAVLEPTERTWNAWQRWLDDRNAWPTQLAVTHGDLHPGHLLVDETGRLVGVLDWTEAKLTDPTVDFAMMVGCFGEQATRDLLHRFERAGGRTWPGLLEHAKQRWAISPVLAADWALRTANDAVLAHARAQLRSLEESTPE